MLLYSFFRHLSHFCAAESEQSLEESGEGGKAGLEESGEGGKAGLEESGEGGKAGLEESREGGKAGLEKGSWEAEDSTEKMCGRWMCSDCYLCFDNHCCSLCSE